MAFSLPILGTSAGGTKEIVLDGKTGLLHPVGEAGLEILGANILRLVNDRKYARHLGAAGQQRASKYFSSHVSSANWKMLWRLRADELKRYSFH